MDLTFLRPLYESDQPEAPWAAVYLDPSRDTEDAAHAADLRWRAVREEPAATGRRSSPAAAGWR